MNSTRSDPLYEARRVPRPASARLADPAPPGVAHPPAPPPATVPRVDYPPDPRSLEQRFADELAAVNGLVATPDQLPALLDELGVRTAVVLDESIPLPPGIGRLPFERVAEADAGFTAARAACAVTGTVVVADEYRLASLLPRVHVVAVPRDALVETPGDVLRDLRLFPRRAPVRLRARVRPEPQRRHRGRGRLRRARPPGRHRPFRLTRLAV